MSFTMFEVCVPVFDRGLNVLAAVLKKGAAYAVDQGLSDSSLVEARLAPDMFTLARQVQSASDAAKFAACRLTEVQPPAFTDTETSFAELQARTERTIQLLQQFKPSQFEGSELRTVTLGSGAGLRTFDGRTYLLGFALPNFYFHVTTAYDILRHHGVPLGKRDYLGQVGR
jgi:hypothetical protein